jgi:hypothetical protein
LVWSKNCRALVILGAVGIKEFKLNRLLQQRVVLLEPSLNGGVESKIGDELAVVKLQVGHRGCFFTPTKPAPNRIAFVGESIRCNVWIIHDILKF